MKRLPLANALAAIAGWVDAVGYLHFAHVFVSFMSGNSTVAGIAIGAGMWMQAFSPMLVIGCFVLGSFLGSLVAGLAKAWKAPAVLAFETIVLALAFAVSSGGGELAPAMVPIAIAMGAQNAAMRQVGGVRVSLTYITGALVNLGQSVAETLLGRGKWSTPAIHATMWLSLISGGIAGAFAYTQIGFDALVAPIAALVILGAIEVTLLLRARTRARFTPTKHHE